jgi:hypothetical protein
MVLSVDAVLKSKGLRGGAAPRQQLQVLRSLSRMVQRENINVTAVIVGKPLNKAPHNKKFDHVRVRYVETEERISSELVKALNQAGSGAVLVSEDAELETRMMRRGFEALRISTFRKMLDDGGEPIVGGGQGNGGNRDRKNNRRERGPRPDRKKQNKTPKVEREPRNQEQDEISQMIDLVE